MARRTGRPCPPRGGSRYFEWRGQTRRGVLICPVVIREQRGGSCGVYAGVSCQESRNRLRMTQGAGRIRGAGRMILSPRYAVDRMRRIANQLGIEAEFGAIKTVSFLQSTGTVLSRHYRENGIQSLSHVVRSGLQHYRLASWRVLDMPEQFHDVLEALKEGPIIGCFYCSEQILKLRKNQVYSGRGRLLVGGTRRDGSPIFLRHAVCITGFKGRGWRGHFNCLNSWGSDWGDSGFFKIKKTFVDCFVIPFVPAVIPNCD